MENKRLNDTIEKFQNHLLKSVTSTEPIHIIHPDRPSKSPLHSKIKQREHINEF
jgi:hypothetical protein